MSPSFEQLGIWVACALMFVNLYFKFRPNTRRQVTLEEGAVTKQELAGHIRDDRAEHQLLHDRISKASEASELRSQAMKDDYNEKFQQLPNQIVALLRNTGVIRDRDDRSARP